MFNRRAFLKYWLPVIVWMALIFTASSDAGSAQRSSRIIGPLLRWLFPQMPDETVGAMVLVIRKCAHVAEYGVLSILFWRALRKPQKNDPRPWSWLTARNAFLCTLLYAATDELHQIFVPSRQGMLADVFIDMAGALFGLLFVRVFWLSRKRA